MLNAKLFINCKRPNIHQVKAASILSSDNTDLIDCNRFTVV